jgi:hypothetical protein
MKDKNKIKGEKEWKGQKNNTFYFMWPVDHSES